MKKVTIYLILNLFLLIESRGQGLTTNDLLIAHDSVHSVTFNEQTCWFAKRILMEKLISDTNLISQDTSIANFYSTYINDNIGLLSQIRLAIDTLNKIDSTSAALMKKNISLIRADAALIAYDDSILINADSASIAYLNGQIVLYNDSINAASLSNDTAYSLLHAGINTRAASIKSTNAALSSNKIYEQNEIDINNIYLSTLAINQPGNIINYSSQLYNIAKQCLLSGGPSVSIARNLYHAINDSIRFNDDQICSSPNDTCLVPLVPRMIAGISAGVCSRQYYYTIDSVISATSYTWSVTGYAAIDSGQGSTSIWVTFTDTFINGIISVYASDSCGSGAARSLGVTGFPFAPDSITGATNICPFVSGLPFTIDTVEGATSYAWIVPSGCTIDSGQGSTRIIVDWDSLPGNVKVVALNNCGSSDTTSHFVNLPGCRLSQLVNTANSPANGNIKIYPNPTTGKVAVIYNLNGNNGMLQLYDMIGQMVGSYQLDGNNTMFEFDIADLCCGIFSYRVTDGLNVPGQGRLVIVK